MTKKYIVVTGGVVSGIGKGITAATVGLLLKSSGLNVDVIKFDPYLNIDPGTMSPFEHGEVYVLDDGSETDLDLGHYERFLETDLTGISSVTAGKVYNTILEQEREGAFLGKNVQLIPNVTNHIKSCFAKDFASDVRLIEIGGSTGDMEGDIFLESFRQFRLENPTSVFHIHLGYIPYLACSGEYKSKPMQSSLRELLKSGLQPDLVILRSESTQSRPLDQSIIDKIALFSNLTPDAVVSLPDLNSIYEVPVYTLKTTLLGNLERFFDRKFNPILPAFYDKYEPVSLAKNEIVIGLITKYTKLADAYLSVFESCKIAGVEQGVRVRVVMIDSDSDTLEAEIDKVHGVIVPGGFGKRGMDGKIKAIKYVREQKIPFLGICLGLQMAVVEYARNACGLDVYSSEMFDTEDEKAGKQCVIDFIPGQENIKKKGGTMRLGTYKCHIEGTKQAPTLASRLYEVKTTMERHRHRLEVQNAFVPILELNGLKISGKYYFDSPSEKNKYLVEIVELDTKIHPYFIAIQSHPELLSRPSKAHPLFRGLIQEAKKYSKLG
jgi:CTP synthase